MARASQGLNKDPPDPGASLEPLQRGRRPMPQKGHRRERAGEQLVRKLRADCRRPWHDPVMLLPSGRCSSHVRGHLCPSFFLPFSTLAFFPALALDLLQAGVLVAWAALLEWKPHESRTCFCVGRCVPRVMQCNQVMLQSLGVVLRVLENH